MKVSLAHLVSNPSGDSMMRVSASFLLQVDRLAGVMQARQWPVIGVVGENGALAFWESNGTVQRLYHQDASEITAKIRCCSRRHFTADTGIKSSRRPIWRLFDLAIDFAEEAPRLSSIQQKRYNEYL